MDFMFPSITYTTVYQRIKVYITVYKRQSEVFSARFYSMYTLYSMHIIVYSAVYVFTVGHNRGTTVYSNKV